MTEFAHVDFAVFLCTFCFCNPRGRSPPSGDPSSKSNLTHAPLTRPSAGICLWWKHCRSGRLLRSYRVQCLATHQWPCRVLAEASPSRFSFRRSRCADGWSRYVVDAATAKCGQAWQRWLGVCGRTASGPSEGSRLFSYHSSAERLACCMVRCGLTSFTIT